MIPTILIGEISGCLEGFYIPIVVGVRILGFHGFPVLFLASDGMRILLQRATDHERQEGLSELHANATGLRPGAMGVPSVRCFFLLLRRLAVLWWYGCVWKWCTLVHSQTAIWIENMMICFLNIYILYIGYVVSTHETTWCFFTSNDSPSISSTSQIHR